MKKVKWGVLGTGWIADAMTVPGMQKAENCVLEAVASRSLDKAEAFREKFGFHKAYGEYEALLADPEIEAVYLPLPNSVHYEWIKKAILSGKHVLCEKPMTPCAEQMEELFDLAERKGVILMEAFAYLHSPAVEAIRKEIESGVIGEIRYLEAEFLTETHEPENIRMRRETYGGSMYDLGCYCTSLILRILGKEPEDILAQAVYSEERIDLLTNAVLTFEKDVKASFCCGMLLSEGRKDTMYIAGTKGNIIGHFAFNDCGTLSYSVVTGGKETKKTVETPDNYALEIEQMGRCITENEKPFVSGEFSVLNARVMDRILQKMGY